MTDRALRYDAAPDNRGFDIMSNLFKTARLERRKLPLSLIVRALRIVRYLLSRESRHLLHTYNIYRDRRDFYQGFTDEFDGLTFP